MLLETLAVIAFLYLMWEALEEDKMSWTYEEVREYVREHPSPIPESPDDAPEAEYREWLAQRRAALRQKKQEG